MIFSRFVPREYACCIFSALQKICFFQQSDWFRQGFQGHLKVFIALKFCLMPWKSIFSQSQYSLLFIALRMHFQPITGQFKFAMWWQYSRSQSRSLKKFSFYTGNLKIDWISKQKIYSLAWILWVLNWVFLCPQVKALGQRKLFSAHKSSKIVYFRPPVKWLSVFPRSRFRWWEAPLAKKSLLSDFKSSHWQDWKAGNSSCEK